MTVHVEWLWTRLSNGSVFFVQIPPRKKCMPVLVEALNVFGSLLWQNGHGFKAEGAVPQVISGGVMCVVG